MLSVPILLMSMAAHWTWIIPLFLILAFAILGQNTKGTLTPSVVQESEPEWVDLDELFHQLMLALADDGNSHRARFNKAKNDLLDELERAQKEGLSVKIDDVVRLTRLLQYHR